MATGQHLLFGRPHKGQGPPPPELPRSLFPVPILGPWLVKDQVYLDLAAQLPTRQLYQDHDELICILDGPIGLKDDDRFQTHIGIMPAAVGWQFAFMVVNDCQPPDKRIATTGCADDLDRALLAASFYWNHAQEQGFQPTEYSRQVLTREYWHRAFRWHPASPAGRYDPTHEPELTDLVKNTPEQLLVDRDGLPRSQ